MTGTTTYDHTANVITTIGGTAVAPIAFNDLWLADKAGTQENVHARVITGADASPVAVDHALRPTDYYALGLADVFITVTNFTVNSTIRLMGTDPSGAAQTEDIAITANGTYNSTKYWRTIASTQVTVFGGNFTYALTQGQWGVVWKQTTSQYRLDCRIIVGNGSTSTYLVDNSKQITLGSTAISGTSQDCIYVQTNAAFQLGTLVDAATKRTTYGTSILIEAQAYSFDFIHEVVDALYVYLYGVHFESIVIPSTGTPAINLYGPARIWNCIIEGRVTSQFRGSEDVFNTVWMSLASVGTIIEIFSSNPTFDRVTGFNHYRGFYTSNVTATLRNLYARGLTYAAEIIAAYNGTCYLIDCDIDSWLFYGWTSGTGKIYRQYTFALKVTDKAGVGVSGATVTLKDKDGNTVFSVSTDANGDIAQQTVSRGYYNQANGNTLQEYSPHTLTIAKAGYQTYTKVLTLTDKMVWQITLFKARPILSDGGKLAVNLSPTDPENMMVMVL